MTKWLTYLVPRNPSLLNPTFAVIIEQDKEWQWHIKDVKGALIAASPKSFGSKKACLANLKLLGDKILLVCGSEKVDE